MSSILPLRLFIPLLLFMSSLVASLANLTHMSHQSNMAVENSNIKNVRQIMNQLQFSSEAFLYSNDMAGIKLQLTAAVYSPNTNALLVDERGKVLAVASSLSQSKLLGEVVPFLEKERLSRMADLTDGEVFLSEDRQFVRAIYPIKPSSESDRLKSLRKAALVFEKDLRPEKIIKQNRVKQDVVEHLIIMLGLSLLLWWVFHLFITRRVNRLLVVTRAVADGDLSLLSGLRGQDEFSQISQSLDKMIKNLAINQRELKTSEELLRTSQQQADIGSWEWNVKVNSLCSSEAAEKILGVATGGVKTLESFLKLVYPSDRDALRKAVRHSMDTGETYDLEHRIVIDNNEIRWIHARGDFIRDTQGSPLRMLGIIRDVTERKLVDLTLHLQASALKTAAEGIVIANSDGVVEWVNPAFTQLTGYGFDEIVGQNPKLLKSGKHDPSFYRKMWDTILAGNTWRGEICNKCKNGRLYQEEQSITPVLDDSGEISHFIAIKRDVSERQLLQRQLQQSQKMEVVGQLTGGIAHDFNNMLASILGYTELADERLKQTDDDTTKSYLSEVLKSGWRARDLIAQMLAFSQGGEGDVEPTRLAPLIKESLKMLGSTLPSSIEIKAQLSDDLSVMTNPVQFHQLIMNLCINARDAMEGQGCITIELRRTDHIEAACCSCHETITGDYIQFSVRDTGPGIKPERLEHIFEPFYTTKDVGKGSGMGLSMIHGIMHEQGGHITVETRLGQGSTFILLFPVMNVREEAPKVEGESAQVSEDYTGEGRVLIVDDEATVGGFLGELLSTQGYDVTVETDSRSALMIFQTRPKAFDLVVTDQTMPSLTGVELAQSMLAIRPELPVILCSGYSDIIDKSKAKSLGISCYLDKPIEIDELLRAIKEFL